MNGMSEPIVERPIDHYSFTWKAENLPGLYDSSNTIPGNTLPYFIYEFDYARFYGTLPPPTPKDWRELVLQITENLDIRKNPKKFDALMKEILGDKINASKVEQATFLHDYFNENITLKRLEEKEKSGYLETYFKTKVADWSALVSMYEAAFDWLGVNYYFGTARSKYMGPILLTFPTGYQITDYFFAIEDESGGTHLYIPKEDNIQWQANEIPAHLRGTRVYMLSLNDKETLKQIDFQNNRFNQNQLLFKGKADINLVDGTMTHALQESVTGEISTRYRDRVYAAHKNEKLAENATKKWQNLIPEAKVSNVKLSDYPTESPYKYKIDFAIDTPNQISEIEEGTYKVQFGNCLAHNVLEVKDR